jgi:hypothetical protein
MVPREKSEELESNYKTKPESTVQTITLALAASSVTPGGGFGDSHSRIIS